mgnify:CR=1 FL=1
MKLKYRDLRKSILNLAETVGIKNRPVFEKTLDRFVFLQEVLDELQEAIRKDGMTITKEYVKGRENICINPAVSEYNKTVNISNSTASTLNSMLCLDAKKQTEEAGEASSKLREMLAKKNAC